MRPWHRNDQWVTPPACCLREGRFSLQMALSDTVSGGILIPQEKCGKLGTSRARYVCNGSVGRINGEGPGIAIDNCQKNVRIERQMHDGESHILQPQTKSRGHIYEYDFTLNRTCFNNCNRSRLLPIYVYLETGSWLVPSMLHNITTFAPARTNDMAWLTWVE